DRITNSEHVSLAAFRSAGRRISPNNAALTNASIQHCPSLTHGWGTIQALCANAITKHASANKDSRRIHTLSRSRLRAIAQISAGPLEAGNFESSCFHSSFADMSCPFLVVFAMKHFLAPMNFGRDVALGQTRDSRDLRSCLALQIQQDCLPVERRELMNEVQQLH